MVQSSADDFLVIEQLLAACDSEVSAAEADGRLLSLAAMLGQDAIAVWLNQLGASVDAADVAHYVGQLVTIAERRVAVLERGDGLPDLCLPDDDDDMRDRVESLALWAGGFVSGLGEGAAMRGSPARDRLDQEPLSELLQDFTEITRAEVADDDLAEDTETAETSYNELVEFLRVAAQLCYEELTPVREIAEPAPVHVH